MVPLAPGPTKLKSNVLALASHGSDTATSRVARTTSLLLIVPGVLLIVFLSLLFHLGGCVGLSQTLTSVSTRSLRTTGHFFSRRQVVLVSIESGNVTTVLEIVICVRSIIEPCDYCCEDPHIASNPYCPIPC